MENKQEISPAIICVGYYDRDLDLFESQYPVPEGISYNSYIVKGRLTALMDTVDARGADAWRARVMGELDGSRGPDYLVVQHLEPDHASQIDWVMTRYPRTRLVLTAVAKRLLPMLTAGSEAWHDRIDVVADGDTLDLGGAMLEFVTAPMVHWPEVMMTYERHTGTLFSADAFGRFGNPDPALPWADEARRYYYNIVGKYGPAVLKVLAKLGTRHIHTIAPLHGPVLDSDISRYIDLYRTWASYEPERPGVLVACASIHGNTLKAAHTLAAMLRDAGAPGVQVVDLTRFDQSTAVKMAFETDKMVVMASTYDASVFPPMYDFLHHLALKGYNRRSVGIVQNGLWAPVAGAQMQSMLESMQGVRIVAPPVTINGRLNDASTAALQQLARDMVAAR